MILLLRDSAEIQKKFLSLRVVNFPTHNFCKNYHSKQVPSAQKDKIDTNRHSHTFPWCSSQSPALTLTKRWKDCMILQRDLPALNPPHGRNWDWEMSSKTTCNHSPIAVNQTQPIVSELEKFSLFGHHIEPFLITREDIYREDFNLSRNSIQTFDVLLHLNQRRMLIGRSNLQLRAFMLKITSEVHWVLDKTLTIRNSESAVCKYEGKHLFWVLTKTMGWFCAVINLLLL